MTLTASPRGLTTREQLRIGDRMVAFTALLPAHPQRCVLAVGEPLLSALRHRFPAAHVLTLDSAASDVPVGTDLVVIDLDWADATRLDLDEVSRRLAPSAVVAALGSGGRYAVYPDVERPQQIWRRGWPLPQMVGLRAQLRRNAGLWLHPARGVPTLSVQAPDGAEHASLAGRIGADLGVLLGDAVRLVGITTAGHTILRYRGRVDIAVRVSLAEQPERQQPLDRLVRAVPDVAPLVPVELAHGTTDGFSWVAEPWIPQRRVPLVHAWRRAGLAWRAAGQLADRLATVRTGAVGAGWADAWLDDAGLVPPGRRSELRGMLEVLHGAPTGWAHGDLWPPNVLVEHDRATVIDWDTAVDDAPLGLDHVLIAALRLSAHEGIETGQACARLVGDPDAVDGLVLDRTWSEHSRPHRAALALAAYLLHLRNRDVHDASPDVDALCRVTEPAAPVSTGAGRGAGRGAAWLGLEALVAKGCQTVVLLVLAALLAPAALGVLAIGSLVVTVTSAVTDMGTSTALVHWRGNVQRAARSALTLALTLAVALTAVGWWLAPWLASALGAGATGVWVIRGLLLTVPLDAVSAVHRELLRRELRFARRVWPEVAATLVGAVVSVWLALDGRGVEALVIGQVVRAVLGLLLVWLAHAPVRPGWSLPDVQGLVGYGGHLAGSRLVQLVMLNVDYVLVARALGPEQLGLYSLAFRLAYMPHVLVVLVVCGAAFPFLCRLEHDAVGPAATMLAQAALTVVLPLYVGMALLAHQVTLLGPEWAGTVTTLQLLAGYGLLLGLVHICIVPLNAASRPRDGLLLTLLHLGLLSALVLVAVPHGIAAVAAAQLLAAGLVAATAVGLLSGHLPGFSVLALLRSLRPAALGTALMVVAVLGAQALLPWSGSSLPGLLLVGTLAVAAYAAGVLALDREALPRIRHLLRRSS